MELRSTDPETGFAGKKPLGYKVGVEIADAAEGPGAFQLEPHPEGRQTTNPIGHETLATGLVDRRSPAFQHCH
jgi:hypothetical protein